MRAVSLLVAMSLALPAICLSAVPAANDAKAVFDKGMFLFPELAAPKDSYLIIIKPKVGETVQLALPAGTTGLRVGQGVIPEGEWTWSYKLSTLAVPTIALRTPKKIDITTTDLIDGRLSLAWTMVPGTKRYLITGQTRTKDKPSDDPPWEKLEGGCAASVCTVGDYGTTMLELKPGMEVKWQISAVDVDGIVLAKSEEAQVQVGNTWVQGARNAGFKLQRSDTLNTKSAQLPATISYISNQKTTPSRVTAYQSEFALIYDSPKDLNGFWPRASLEGRFTSSGDKKPEDAAILRGGFYRAIAEAKSGEFTDFVANLKYETERKTGTKKGLVEVSFTPIYGWLGRQWPGPPKKGNVDEAGNYLQAPWARIAPVISFGAEVGKTMDVGSSTERQDTILRLRGTLRLDAELNALSSALGTQSATAYLEGSYWHLPKEQETRNFRLGKTGLSFGLTEVVSLDFSYSVGKEAPLFKFSRTGSAGFGLKF